MQEVQSGILCGYCGSVILPDSKEGCDVCQKCRRKYDLSSLSSCCTVCFYPVYYVTRKFDFDTIVCSNPECPLFTAVGNKLMYKNIEILRVVDTCIGERITSIMPETAFDDFCKQIRHNFLLIPL